MAKTKRYLIFGGTGSLGTTLTRRLAKQQQIIGIFSRDEAKNFAHKWKFRENQENLQYFIGDVRKYESVLSAIQRFQPDVIIAAAAMKQVPLCEEFPEEAMQTNVLGTANIARAAAEYGKTAKGVKVLSISTDKAVKPVNAYGFTKALQERIHLRYNHPSVFGGVVFNCVRYGNVLESTGSVIPVFKSQLQKGENLTVTDKRMTRFLLSLDEAVDLIFKALKDDMGGKIFIPALKSARIIDVAEVMCRAYGRDPAKSIRFTGIRPGEKLHELLVSEEECHRVLFNEKQGFFSIEELQVNTFDWLSENTFSSGYSESLFHDQSRLEKFLVEKGVICKSESPAQAVS